MLKKCIWFLQSHDASQKESPQALSAVLKGGGAEPLDTFSDLADRFGADIQEGQVLQGTFGSRSKHWRAL